MKKSTMYFLIAGVLFGLALFNWSQIFALYALHNQAGVLFTVVAWAINAMLAGYWLAQGINQRHIEINEAN